MARNKNIPVTSTGPALGNVPTPDSYLRLKQNIDGLQTKLGEVQLLASTPRPFTPDQLTQLQHAIQAGGPNPLNLTALPGILLQTQPANVTEVTALPAIGSSSDGELVLYRKVLWRFSGKTRKWSPVSTIVIVDYSYNLTNYPPSQYAPGVVFVSLDSGVVFVEEDLISAGITTPTWVPLITGSIAFPHAARRSSGTLNTTGNSNGSPATWASGDHFLPSMAGQQIWISGNLYPVVLYSNNNAITLGSNLGGLSGAAYIFEYASVNYPAGTIFIETDRNVEYYAGNATGVVNVSGNNVSWVSGQKFDVYWRSLVIGNNAVAVSSVASNRTALVTSAPAGNGNNQGLAVASGAWFYATGQYTNNLNGIPADLESADANYSFGATDYNHSYKWNGNNWNFSPGEAGSAYVIAGSALPFGGPWGLCDGSSYVVAQDNATLTSVATANLTNNVFIRGGNPSSPQGATAPTWTAGAKTDDITHNHTYSGVTSIVGDHTHVVNANTTIINYTPGNGSNLAPASTVASPTDPAGSHGHSYSGITDNETHSHNLSNNNALMNPPGDINGGVPFRINLAWYMRR